MKKIIILFLLISLAKINAFSVEEITSTVPGEFATSVFPNKIERVKELIEELKKKKGITKEEFISEISNVKEEQRRKIKDLEDRIETLTKERVKNLEGYKVKIKEKIDELGINLNEKQNEALERLYDKINELNKIHTDNYLKYLFQIEEKLLKLEAKAREIESRGIDVSSIELALIEAQEKINELKSKVIEQQSKIYSFTDLKAPLRNYFAQKIEELRNDHQNLRQLIVKEGREVVRKVLEEVKNTLKVSTSTPQK